MRDHAMTHPTDRAERGFSLLEVMIAATILFTIIGVAAQFIGTSTKLLGTKSAHGASEQTAAQIADQIARQMRNGALRSLKMYFYQPDVAPPADNFPEMGTYTSIYWREVESNDGVPVYGDGYYIFPAIDENNYTDNIDNDRDARTDEICVRMYRVPKAEIVNSLTMPATPNRDPGAWSNYNPQYYFPKSTKLAEIRWYNTMPLYPPAPQSTQPGIQFIRVGSVMTIRVIVVKYDPTSKTQFNQMAEATVKLRN